MFSLPAGSVPISQCRRPLLAGGNDRNDTDFWPRAARICPQWFPWGISTGTCHQMTSSVFFFSDPFFSLPLSIYNSICPIFKILPSCHLCSLLASGVQFFAEGTGLSACYQTLLSQHQVQTRQQQRCLTSTCGETLLSYLHETASCGVGPHQTLLQLTSKKLNHRVVFSPDQICDWCDVGFFQLMYLFYT